MNGNLIGLFTLRHLRAPDLIEGSNRAGADCPTTDFWPHIPSGMNTRIFSAISV
jgi:hypothetical protein